MLVEIVIGVGVLTEFPRWGCTIASMTPEATRSAVAHLVRRAAFGAPADVIDQLAALGYAGAVESLCDFTVADAAADAVAPPTFATDAYIDVGDDADARRAAARQLGEERRMLIAWWMRRMVAADRPSREWLTFVWHDHFATSMQKVKFAALMHGQYVTLYEGAGGRFDDLVGAIARDPAMLIWLDGRRNTAAAPNENFARELFELFTLGHGTHGAQPYTESDVAEAARALTGWGLDRQSMTSTFRPGRHDGGSKSVLGNTGNLGLDEVVAAATGHRASAPFVTAALWSTFARPAGPDDPIVAELAVPFADDFDITGLLRRMFLHPEFISPTTRGALLKSPVQFVVGTARALRVEPDVAVLRALRRLGQVPFLPPDVSGWPSNEAWTSTSSSQARLDIALNLAAAATDVVDVLAAEPKSDRPSALARVLGVDRWSPTTAAALAEAADDPTGLLALAIAAPEHLLA